MNGNLRLFAALIFFVFVVVYSPLRASAYEADVHFELTYVLARLAGLPDPKAYLIARADQSQDDNASTTAFRFPLPPPHYQQHGMDWHALNFDQRAVMKRFQALQCRAGVIHTTDRGIATDCTDPLVAAETLRLVELGQFLHYYEDTYAHSRANEMTQQWIPYGAALGHLFQGIQPDLIPNRPQLAQLMALEIFDALKSFASDRGYKPATYPSPEQIRAIVGVIAGAYANPHRAADLNAVRCAVGLYVRQNSLLSDEPAIERVGYQTLSYDESGLPLGLPDKPESSPIASTKCAGF